jgi:hypothetical protein
MGRKDRLLVMAERGRFLATLDDDSAVDGVLVDWDESHLILGDVTSVAATGDRLAVDGELWLPRPRIKYLQKIRT